MSELHQQKFEDLTSILRQLASARIPGVEDIVSMLAASNDHHQHMSGRHPGSCPGAGTLG